jgi:hypothetical protein
MAGAISQSGKVLPEVQSRITGLTVPTELIDLVEVRKGRIISYTEFFVPLSRGAPNNSS